MKSDVQGVPQGVPDGTFLARLAIYIRSKHNSHFGRTDL